MVRSKSALAAKLEPAAQVEIKDESRPKILAEPANWSHAVQASLFEKPKVVPIQSYAPTPPRPASRPRPAPRADAGVRTPSKPAPKRASRVNVGQGTLDFLQPAPVRPRTLSTSVEAVIYCDEPVATVLHRAVAGALDAAMVVIGYGLFMVVFQLCGGEFVLNRTNLLLLGAILPVIAVAYGLTWTVAATETPGMRWTRLRLTTFEGFPPEPRHRVLRFLGSCLSVCTLVGLLWSFADEESLMWQDHISHTFPTPGESGSRVMNRR